MRLLMFWSMYFGVLILGGLMLKFIFNSGLDTSSFVVALGSALFWLIESKREIND